MYAKEEDDEYLDKFIYKDVPMQVIRDVSGQKRSLRNQTETMEQSKSGSVNNSSPQRSPPPKREKPSTKSSVNPDDTFVRERGES
jgi:hypothetical protein